MRFEMLWVVSLGFVAADCAGGRDRGVGVFGIWVIYAD